MKKSIRLLVENLFDDLYDIDQESNLTIDIADKMYKPDVGYIYYENKKPYALCCGNAEDFKDNKARFLLIKKEFKKARWNNKDFFVDKLGKHDLDDFYVKSKNNFQQIDETGYENTQVMKNNDYSIPFFPAFDKCIKLGDDIYLPAIDELQIMLLNKDKLNEILNNISGAKLLAIKDNNDNWSSYWSSTQASLRFSVRIEHDSGKVNKMFKTIDLKVRPFVKINL